VVLTARGRSRSGVRADARHFFALGAIADVLRVGAWFAFLLLLSERRGAGAAPVARAGPSRTTWLVPVAAALVVLGVVAQGAAALGVPAFGDPGRLALFDSLALTLFGLMLIEQLFRGVPEDARWSIKPLCLGLAGGFAFDLYLFADALLFSRVDADPGAFVASCTRS
jgi:hypothetical protein